MNFLAVIAMATLLLSGCGDVKATVTNVEKSPPAATTTPSPTPSEPVIPTAPVIKTSSDKVVALSFDDGPDEKWTPKILDILKEQNVKATFFLVGTQVKKHPDMVKRILAEGHDISNHSWDHKDLTKLTPQAMSDEIKNTSEAIFEAAGVYPNLCRAPYGATNSSVKEVAKTQGCVMVGWQVDTRDWAGDSVDTMMKAVRSQVRPGAVVLEHSFGGKNSDLSNTVALLPQMISYLKSEGYSIVKVSDLYETPTT
jgi:peptidoglycan/xylan/chitin deacetylase (PgdA/CDA1 family)